MKSLLLALTIALLSSCALLAPAPDDAPGGGTYEPPVVTGPGNTPSPTTPAPAPSPTTTPRAADNYAGRFNSPTAADLLRPNAGADLPFPIYSQFSQVEPLLNLNDGTTYVVNFWASWCRPCLQEMPLLQRMMNERTDVKVITISLDKPQDVRTKLLDLVYDRNINLPIVALTDDAYDKWRSRVDRTWTRTTIPVTLVYNGGRRRFNKGAILDYEQLSDLVRRVR